MNFGLLPNFIACYPFYQTISFLNFRFAHFSFSVQSLQPLSLHLLTHPLRKINHCSYPSTNHWGFQGIFGQFESCCLSFVNAAESYRYFFDYSRTSNVVNQHFWGDFSLSPTIEYLTLAEHDRAIACSPCLHYPRLLYLMRMPFWSSQLPLWTLLGRSNSFPARRELHDTEVEILA